MADVKQQTADTLAMVSLMSETLVDTDSKLEKVSGGIDAVGTHVVQTHEFAKGAKEQVEHQNESLEEIRKGQEDVSSQSKELHDSINGTAGKIESQTEVLKTLHTAVTEDNQAQAENHKELMAAVDLSNGEFAEKVAQVDEKLDSTNQEIKTLDNTKLLQNVIDVINSAKSEMTKISEVANTNNQAVSDKIDNVGENINELVTKLSALSDYTDELNTDFQTAISRMSSINVKLEAVTESESAEPLADEQVAAGEVSEDVKENEGE